MNTSTDTDAGVVIPITDEEAPRLALALDEDDTADDDDDDDDDE